MSMLERVLESALVKALKGQEFTGADSVWVKPVAGMANAYIAVETPTGSAEFSDGSQTAYVTPVFRLLIDIGQVETFRPMCAGESDTYLLWHLRGERSLPG